MFFVVIFLLFKQKLIIWTLFKRVDFLIKCSYTTVLKRTNKIESTTNKRKNKKPKKGHRGIQRGTERYRGIQRDTEGYRGTQRDTEGHRETQEDTGKYKKDCFVFVVFFYL